MKTGNGEHGRKNANESPVEAQAELFERTDGDLTRECLRHLTDAQEAVGATKRIAAELGVDAKTLHNWLNPNIDRQIPLPKLLQFITKYRPTGLVDYLCDLAGGFFVPTPDTPAAATNMASIRKLQADAAGLVEALSNIPPGDTEDARLRTRIVLRRLAAIEKGLTT